MSNHDLFYLFLERSNFDVERLIFFLLIKFMGKKQNQKRKREAEELFLACKQQITKASTAVVLKNSPLFVSLFVSENTQKGESWGWCSSRAFTKAQRRPFFWFLTAWAATPRLQQGVGCCTRETRRKSPYQLNVVPKNLLSFLFWHLQVVSCLL